MAVTTQKCHVQKFFFFLFFFFLSDSGIGMTLTTNFCKAEILCAVKSAINVDQFWEITKFTIVAVRTYTLRLYHINSLHAPGTS